MGTYVKIETKYKKDQTMDKYKNIKEIIHVQHGWITYSAAILNSHC